MSVAERRQLTVLFCDLVASTALGQRLDPEDFREIVGRYYDAARVVAERHDGCVGQYLGDGLLVYFGYPRAHEDDGERAVRAGLEILDALGPLNAELTRDRQLRLAVRIGIHTGLVVVGELGRHGNDLALGDTMNVAARVQTVAQPDTVVISGATLRLVAGLFVTQDLGARTLKGVTEPLRLYRVLQPSGVRSRLDVSGGRLTPFVGRTQEVGLLLDRWEQVQEGRGQVVSISGEAGVGKSRLVQMLRDRIAETPHTWLECRCSHYAEQNAFHPMIELLQQGFGLGGNQSDEERLRKLEQGLSLVGLPVPAALPLLATLLSIALPDRHPQGNMTPELQRRRTLELLITWAVSLSRRQPLILLFEDLHWSDPSTLDLLSLAVEQVPTTAVLLVLTSRPEFAPPWPGRSHHTHIRLQRLSERQVKAMIAGITPGMALPEAVVEEIVTRVDGVPLYVEEMTKMALESGLLVPASGGYELSGSLEALAIPTTLQGSLMARLDRLSAAKEVAQLGATIGREFSYALVRAVAVVDEPTLRQALAQLVEAEILYERGLAPQATYTFKHALIQETAYQSLLKATRRQMHARIVEVCEVEFPDFAAREAGTMARHCDEGGLVDKAIEYHRLAGEQAAARSANAEAITHFRRAIELLSRAPATSDRDARELVMQVALGALLVEASGYGTLEVQAAYQRAWELSANARDLTALPQILVGLNFYYVVRGDVVRAEDAARRLLALAGESRDGSVLASARFALGAPAYWRGDFREALMHLEDGMSLETRDSGAVPQVYGHDSRIAARIYAAWSRWIVGYPDRALSLAEDAVRRARELRHPFTLGFALAGLGLVLQMRRETADVIGPVADEVLELSVEQGFPIWAGLGRIVRSWVLADRRDESWSSEVETGMVELAGTGLRVGTPQILAGIAELYLRRGTLDDAIGVLDAALAASVELSNAYWDADLLRLQAETVLARDGAAVAESERLFQRALDVARSQQAKSLELRAATSLARLWQRQGRRLEAAGLLSPVLAWFSEGFDTPDIASARRVMVELT